MKSHVSFLLLAASTLFVVTMAQSQTWKPLSAPATNWICVASSANGTNLFAAARGGTEINGPPGQLYRSDDAGLSWTESPAPLAKWRSISSSGDGTTLIAAVEDALLVSTDSGTTWVDRTPASIGSFVYLYAVAASADARVLVAANSIAAGYNWASQIFVSTNLGLDWSMMAADEFVQSVACSGDGRTILAGALEGSFSGATYFSTNNGVTWNKNYGGGTWESVACSAGGTRPVAIRGFGSNPPSAPIWLSLDAGASWQQITNSDAVVGSRATIATSADARHLAIAIDGYPGGAIFTSTDSGLTWNHADAPITNWTSIASSADGTRLLASTRGGQLYVSQTRPEPLLGIASSGDSVLLSWLIPSRTFVLQQSPDLGPSSWSDVSIPLGTNWSALRHEVTLLAPAASTFFRLTSR